MIEALEVLAAWLAVIFVLFLIVLAADRVVFGRGGDDRPPA